MNPLIVSTEMLTAGFLNIASNACFNASVPPGFKAFNNRAFIVGLRLIYAWIAETTTAWLSDWTIVWLFLASCSSNCWISAADSARFGF